MAVQTTISSLSQTAASNGPDGASDPPSALDDAIRYHGAFIAQLRDGKGHAAEVDVASAATCDIGGANSPFVRITGTTTITSLGTNYNGPRFLRFADALTLTHNASTLILPGGASITTAAGDTCTATPISGGWVVSNYQRADATVLRPLTSGTVVSASGTAVTFTDIPSWVKRITISVSALSTNGTSLPIIQIGDSGGVEASGYTGTVYLYSAGDFTSAFSTGFAMTAVAAPGSGYEGTVTLTLVDGSTNTWAATIVVGHVGGGAGFGGGSKSLTATLDRIRLTTVIGTNTFDAGKVNVLYE